MVDIGMLDSVTALLTYQAGIFFATGEPPRRMGNRHPTIVPYETFEASDGDFVLAVGNDEQWRRFCEIGGLPFEDRFATNRQRVALYDELRPVVAGRLKQQTRAEWIARLNRASIPCGTVRSLDELFGDAQIAARQMVVDMPHQLAGQLRLLGVPIKLSDTPGDVRTPPPVLGEHTDAVLHRDVGLSTEAIAALRGQRIV